MVKKLEVDGKKYFKLEGIKYVYLGRGKRLFSEGDSGSEMFVVMDGEVKVFISRGDKNVVLDVVKKGGFLGEMSLLEGEPRSASVVAMRNTELMIVDRSSMMLALRKFPKLGLKIMKVLSNRLRRSNAVISSLNLKINELEEKNINIHEEKEIKNLTNWENGTDLLVEF